MVAHRNPKFFLPQAVEEINGKFETFDGAQVNRTELTAFNLEDAEEMAAFIRPQAREIDVPDSDRKVIYDPLKRIGVGLSRLGTSRAISIGAYAFALHTLDAGNPT